MQLKYAIKISSVSYFQNSTEIYCSFETLKDYIVEYKHLILEEPITELQKQTLKKMSMDAANTDLETIRTKS